LHGELARELDQPLEDEQPTPTPDPDLVLLVAQVRRAREGHHPVPRLEHHLHRLTGLEDVPQAPRPALLLVATQHEAQVVHVHRVQVEADGRQRHRRADLQEAAHPGVGQVDLQLLERVLGGGLHLEARGVDLEHRRLVATDLLELVVKVRRIVDVRRPAGELADVLEDLIRGPEPAVGRLVLAEALEEDLVRVHRDHRVEHEPGVEVLLVEVIEVLLPGRVEPGHAAVAGRLQAVELALQVLDLRRVAAALDRHLLPVQLLLLGQPRLVRGLVLGLVAQVADHHRVQRRDGLAELEALLQLAAKVGRFAPRVRRERHVGRPRARVDRGAPVVLVLKLHRAPLFCPSWSTAAGA
jgi:hypothetical protein